MPDGHEPADDDALEALSSAARAIREGVSQGAAVIVTEATHAISSARWAGLIVLEKGRLVPRAADGEPPRRLDELQQELGTGPCFDAAREQRVVEIGETRTDPRWPEFAAEAQRVGVHSMLCVPLWVDDKTLGTLSLYGEKEAAFGDYDRRLATLYATLAALAIADGRRIAQITLAVQSRDVIGQAKGILAERLDISPDAAFRVLSTISQDTNAKLVTVAERVVRTRQAPQ